MRSISWQPSQLNGQNGPTSHSLGLPLGRDDARGLCVANGRNLPGEAVVSDDCGRLDYLQYENESSAPGAVVRRGDLRKA